MRNAAEVDSRRILDDEPDEDGMDEMISGLFRAAPAA